MTTLDDLSSNIMSIVSDYKDEIQKELEGLLDKTADEMLKYIQNNAPRSGKKNAVADSFKKLELGKGIDKTVVIYSKSRGRIIHLIEFGYRHRNGKFIPARAFMRPAYDTFTPEMIDKIKKIIERGSQ